MTTYNEHKLQRCKEAIMRYMEHRAPEHVSQERMNLRFLYVEDKILDKSLGDLVEEDKLNITEGKTYKIPEKEDE